MGKLDSWNADARDDMFWFAPEKLVVVTDPKSDIYDERVHLALDEALVQNIMIYGVLEPVVVRMNGKKDGKPVVEVVAGRQRVRCAVEANKRLKAEGKEPIRVPTIRKRTDAATIFGVMISENEIRRGDGPIVRAKKLARFMSMGKSEKEAAITFGIHQATVKNLLSLLDLHEDVQKAVEKEGLPASTVAKELSNMPREEQPAALQKLVEAGLTKGAAGVEAARRVARGAKATSDKAKMMRRPELLEWQKRLKKIEGKDAEIAYAVVSHILGGGRAFTNFPRLRASVEEKEEGK